VKGLIATGGYGRVALASVEGVESPASKVAIKVYCKDKMIANRLLLETYDQERTLMLENAMYDCQWLVQLRGTFGDLWNRYLIMVRVDTPCCDVSKTHFCHCCRRFAVQDYYPSSLTGIIFDPRVRPLPSYILRHWIEELVRFSLLIKPHGSRILMHPPLLQQTLGMYELYNRAIVHCDLKPGNILVSPKGHLAIADFGISMVPDDIVDPDKPLDECKFFSYGGTYAYQAPELLISHHGASFTCAADMWSYGVIIFEMYTGQVRPARYLLSASSTLKL